MPLLFHVRCIWTIVSEININVLAYLFTRMHPETRFNPETVAPISPCFSFAEAQSFVNVLYWRDAKIELFGQ